MEEASSPDWRKSSYCESSGCIEVAVSGESVLVRDSKDPHSPVLRISKDAWQAFVDEIRSGDL